MTVPLANVSFLNNTAHNALNQLQTFSTVLSADPALYGFNAAVAADVAVLVDAFATEFALAGVDNRQAVNEGGYTKPGRAALQAARDAAVSAIRPMMFQIHANPGISDEDKLLIGVVPVNNSRTPIFVPTTAPIVSFKFASMGSHTLSFADENTPASARKPFGAAGMQLFVGIGPEPTPLNLLRFSQNVTRNPIVQGFEPEDAGLLATYAARWYGKRGDLGPWSQTVNATIMFSQAEPPPNGMPNGNGNGNGS